MQTKYSTIANNGRSWVMRGKQPIAAVATCGIRSYLYPLCTPRGAIVLQECPPDHRHHQGIMIGQDFVNGHNFWAPQHALNVQLVESLQETIDESGVTIMQGLRWVTRDGQSILHEQRQSRFEACETFHLVDITTTWKADFGDLYFGVTKEGGLGMRVHPQLETFWGGTIRSSKGNIGEKKVFDTLAEWIEVSGTIADRDLGVVMMPHPSQPQIPWFVRNYGLHMYSPRRHTPLRIAAGSSTSLRVGFAAYDGKSDGSQAEQAWRQYQMKK